MNYKIEHIQIIVNDVISRLSVTIVHSQVADIQHPLSLNSYFVIKHYKITTSFLKKAIK